MLVNKIGKELKRNNPQAKIQIERTWQKGTELIKPDITMMDEEKKHCTVIEITSHLKSAPNICNNGKRIKKVQIISEG